MRSPSGSQMGWQPLEGLGAISGDRNRYQDENDLVSLSQSGSVCAFNRIVARYQAQVVNLAARMLGNRTQAEDVAQEAFISAYRSIGRFRGGSLRAWLMRIAANGSRDELRRRQRRRDSSLEQSLENPTFQPVSGSESPDDAAIRGELDAEIQRAILSLPIDQRTVLVMVDVQGLSYAEAAEAVNASVGTVKSRLSRARSKVRDILMQRRELLGDYIRLKE